MRNDRKSNPIATVFVLLVVLAALGLAGNADRKDAEVTTATIQEVATAGIVYSKPAAYRLQTPTQEQMDNLEHLRVVAKLVEQ